MSDSTRSVNFSENYLDYEKLKCDGIDPDYPDLFNDTAEWRGPAWYRFTMPAGTRIPESPPNEWHCNTRGTGWLSGVHPTSTAESVDVVFCFYSDDGDCLDSSRGKITNCAGEFFVYYLEDAPSCPQRYCATN